MLASDSGLGSGLGRAVGSLELSLLSHFRISGTNVTIFFTLGRFRDPGSGGWVVSFRHDL